MDFSLVVPVLDEAPNVIPLCREIDAALGGRFEFEAVFVDDGSRDDTAACLAQAQSTFAPWLRVLRHRRRYGQSAALLTGASAARARWIVTLDGDGQNDPTDIPRLLASRHAPPGAAGPPALVAGIRTVRRDNALRRLSSRVANGVRGRLLGDGVTDTGCGLKLIERECLLALPRFDHMHRFLPALVRRQGCEIVCVPVAHRSRTRGRSKYGVHNRLWVGIVDLLGVLWLNHRPLVPDAWEVPVVGHPAPGPAVREAPERSAPGPQGSTVAAPDAAR